MSVQLTADHPAVEQQGVERHVREAEAQAVEHGDERHRLALDAGLLVDLLDRDLAGRVADVGVAHGVEPHPGVGSLGEQQLTLVVGDDGRDRHLRRDVALHAPPDAEHPFLEQRVGLGLLDRHGPDVGRDLEHLLEALLLVEALGEAHARAGDGGEGLGPPEQVDGGGAERLGHGPETRTCQSSVTCDVRRATSVARSRSRPWRSLSRLPSRERT